MFLAWCYKEQKNAFNLKDLFLHQEIFCCLQKITGPRIIKWKNQHQLT